MKQDGIGRETNHKRHLISQNKLRTAGGEVGRERVVGLWTLGKVCAMKCVNLVIQTCTPVVNNKLYVTNFFLN